MLKAGDPPLITPCLCSGSLKYVHQAARDTTLKHVFPHYSWASVSYYSWASVFPLQIGNVFPLQIGIVFSLQMGIVFPLQMSIVFPLQMGIVSSLQMGIVFSFCVSYICHNNFALINLKYVTIAINYIYHKLYMP